ncbi:MAG: hypothetical protein ACRCX8_20250 [Sarcina sp.]
MRVYADWFKLIHIDGTYNNITLTDTEAVSLIGMLKDGTSVDRMVICKNSVVGVRNKEDGVQIYKEEYIEEDQEYKEISVYLKKKLEESFIYNIEKTLKEIEIGKIENINKAQEVV